MTSSTPASAVAAAAVAEPAAGMSASQAPSQLAASKLVYALGSDTLVPANPYDARQMADYLASDISEARSLIWTLNIELTPVYAIEPKGPFERVSIPGLQSGRGSG